MLTCKHFGVELYSNLETLGGFLARRMTVDLVPVLAGSGDLTMRQRQWATRLQSALGDGQLQTLLLDVAAKAPSDVALQERCLEVLGAPRRSMSPEGLTLLSATALLFLLTLSSATTAVVLFLLEAQRIL